MRTEEKLRDEIAVARKQKIFFIEREAALAKELADMLSEYKAGQRVMYGGSEYEVVCIEAAWSGGPRYIGRKVLKSGALHKNTQVLWDSLITKKEDPA